MTPVSAGLAEAGFEVEQLLSVALWLAGAGHFCVLGASFQVPARLGWKYDLLKLASFNRKLMWTYSGFTLLTIIAFGLLTLSLHEEFLKGEPAALGLASFIGVFWTLRLLVDLFYFTHENWPAGRGMVLGHVLLSTLFVALATTYLGLVAWHSSAGGA